MPLLGSSLFEGDTRMRLFSAEGLTQLADASSLESLQSSLSREKDKAVRLAVLRALGRIDDPKAARLLRLQTTKTDPKEREQVVMAYLELGQPEQVSSLELLLRDRDERVRWLAFLATYELDEAAGQALFSSSLRSPPSTFMQDFELLSAPRQDKLIKELARHSSKSVQPAALGYALQHPERFAPLLKELVLDPDYKETARMTILTRMAERPSKAHRQIFERLASKEAASERLARMASWFLVREVDASMEATLRGMTSRKDPVLRALAAYGLMTSSKAS